MRLGFAQRKKKPSTAWGLCEKTPRYGKRTCHASAPQKKQIRNDTVWPCFTNECVWEVPFFLVARFAELPKKWTNEISESCVVDAGISGFIRESMSFLSSNDKLLKVNLPMKSTSHRGSDWTLHIHRGPQTSSQLSFFISRGILPNTWDYLSIFEVKVIPKNPGFFVFARSIWIQFLPSLNFSYHSGSRLTIFCELWLIQPIDALSYGATPQKKYYTSILMVWNMKLVNSL